MMMRHRSPSGAAALLLLAWTLVAGCTAETSSPPADAHARWWAHVQRLASDDMRGRETGSAEHRHAAEYVAEAFKAAGLAPAGTDGYRQPVTFRSRRIDEVQSSLALVRDGTRTPVTLGEEATFGMRIDAAPDVEAPLVFAGHGLQIPEAQHDDFAGLDVKGKVVVYLSGSPRAIPGALSAHYQSAAERWATLKRLGAIGTIAIPNPKSTDVPWERSAQPAQPGALPTSSPPRTPVAPCHGLPCARRCRRRSRWRPRNCNRTTSPASSAAPTRLLDRARNYAPHIATSYSA